MNKAYAGLVSLVCALGSGSLLAVDSKVVEIPKASLEALIVTVNGETRRIPSDADVMVVAGDELILKSAVLTSSTVKYGFINLIGFATQENPLGIDDRNVKIHTDRDLIKAKSDHKAGEVYKIAVGQGRRSFGEMRLRVVRPELRYAALDVNGVARILRPGEIAIFKSTDKFKVKDVVTNVENDERDVKYQIVAVSERIELATKVQFYELRFLRNGRVFAQIPLQIEER